MSLDKNNKYIVNILWCWFLNENTNIREQIENPQMFNGGVISTGKVHNTCSGYCGFWYDSTLGLRCIKVQKKEGCVVVADCKSEIDFMYLLSIIYLKPGKLNNLSFIFFEIFLRIPGILSIIFLMYHVKSLNKIDKKWHMWQLK